MKEISNVLPKYMIRLVYQPEDKNIHGSAYPFENKLFASFDEMADFYLQNKERIGAIPHQLVELGIASGKNHEYEALIHKNEMKDIAPITGRSYINYLAQTFEGSDIVPLEARVIKSCF